MPQLIFVAAAVPERTDGAAPAHAATINATAPVTANAKPILIFVDLIWSLL
jgi:hypothetical protein